MKDKYQFSLFIQAMSNLQAEGYTPVPASWKEIGTQLLFLLPIYAHRVRGLTSWDSWRPICSLEVRIQ